MYLIWYIFVGLRDRKKVIVSLIIRLLHPSNSKNGLNKEASYTVKQVVILWPIDWFLLFDIPTTGDANKMDSFTKFITRIPSLIFCRYYQVGELCNKMLSLILQWNCFRYPFLAVKAIMREGASIHKKWRDPSLHNCDRIKIPFC